MYLGRGYCRKGSVCPWQMAGESLSSSSSGSLGEKGIVERVWRSYVSVHATPLTHS